MSGRRRDEIFFTGNQIKKLQQALTGNKREKTNVNLVNLAGQDFPRIMAYVLQLHFKTYRNVDTKYGNAANVALAR